MKRIARRYFLILLTVFLTVFVPQNPLSQEQGGSSVCSVSALHEGTVLPYGFPSPGSEEKSFCPDDGRISLHRWGKTDSGFLILSTLQAVGAILFRRIQTGRFFRQTALFSALHVSCGTYQRKLVPRSFLLS